MRANIKEQNQWAIRDFAIRNQHKRITGNKLRALYKLTQRKGTFITGTDERFTGVKALEFDKGEYVAFIHKPIEEGKFFPCVLRTYHIQNL